MGYIINLFNKELTTKLIAAFLGIMLWFIVLNINDPFGERKIYVELEVRNENVLQEKNLYLGTKNYRRTVEVVVRGREKTLNSLNGADFEAILDFGKVNSVNDKSIPIEGPYYTKNDNQITITSMSPKEIPIELENVMKKELPVEIELKGTPKESYKIIKTIIEPEYVSIHDRESLINVVSKIKAVVDISNIDKDKKVIKQPCIVYNENKEEISELSNKFTVDIVVDVGKEVSIEPFLRGEPAGEHIVTGWKLNIPNAIVTGAHDIVSGLTSISTAQINIDGIAATKDYKVQLNLPEGIKLYNMENETTVTVEVEKLEEKEITIDKRFINIENAEKYTDTSGNAKTEYLQYQILTEDCKVLLKGRSVKLSTISSSILTPHIDVSGLQEGTHNIQLKISANPDIQIVELPTVTVKVTKVSNENPETNLGEDNVENGSVGEDAVEENTTEGDTVKGDKVSSYKKANDQAADNAYLNVFTGGFIKWKGFLALMELGAWLMLN